MDVLTVKNVRKEFSVESGIFRQRTGAVRALDNVSLRLAAGKVIGLVGESGSGKTTLGKVICGLLAPDRGEVLIDGRNLSGYSRKERAAKVQMVFQDPFASLNPKLSIGTMLHEAAGFMNAEHRKSRIDDILGLTGLSPSVLSSYPHQFSGGQRQRIAIARALLRKPEIIVADEPLSSLDISIQNQLLDLFMTLKKMHLVSFVFISHDLVVTSNLADYLMVMKNGTIVEEGPTEAVLTCPKDRYTQDLLSAVPYFERQ